MLAVSAFMLVAGAVVAIGAGRTVAQEAEPDAPINPIVGSWMLSFPTVPDAAPALAVFTPTGEYIQQEAGAGGGIGAWQANDDGSIGLTAHFLQTDQQGVYAGALTIRGTVTVDSSGDRWTAEYTIEMTGPDGSVIFADGPFQAEATRIAVEPMEAMGTPAAEAEASPAA